MRFSSLARPLALPLLFATALALAGCDAASTLSGEQNTPPTAKATVGASMVDVGTEVTLDGSGSSDPDGDDLSYSWSLTTPSGSNASLSDPNAVKPTFTPDVKGDYEATLEVSDGNASDTDQATTTAESATVEISSNITSDRTLTSDNSYLVTTTVAVEDGATLTIEAGTQIMFENDVALWINSGAAIDANGASGNPVTMTATPGNEQRGWWRGLALYSGNANNSLDYVEIRHAGSDDMSGISKAANVALDDGAVLNLTNSTISDSDKYGLYLDAADASLESFSSNSFSNTGKAPMWIPFTNIGRVDAGSSFPSGATVRVYGATLKSGDITVNALSGDTPYRFSGRANINGASVTIKPGVEMTFESDVAFWVQSELVASGTSSDPITMTATAGNEQRGWWRGVAIYSNNANNTLDHVEVRHAGSNDMSGISKAANVALDDGAVLNLTNSTLTKSGKYGLYLDASDASLASFSSNSFSGHGRAPMWIPFTNIGTVDSGSSFASGSTVRVYQATLKSGSVTIDSLSGDTPYRFSGRPNINGASVTINPGVEMTFESDVAFWVQSEIVAEGTASNPITMTATSGNEQQGWWRGVAIYSNNANNAFDHVEIRHAGNNDMSGISKAANVALDDGAVLSLTNSIVGESGKWGVYCDASTSSFSGSNNTYENNASGAIEGCQ